MNTQIANRIQFIPVHDIQSFENGVITLLAGKTWYKYHTENELEFEEQALSKESFDGFDQSLKPIIITTKAIIDSLLDRPLIVKLFVAGTEYIWGTLDNGVQFYITTHTDRYLLNMTRQSTVSVF
jgi:hypothetical protein